MEETINGFSLRSMLCAGAPIREPDGDPESLDGKDREPLPVMTPISLSDNVFNGERPLVCPYIIRRQDRDYCGAWIGLPKHPNGAGVVLTRYKPDDIPPCRHAYRVAKK